MATLNFPPSQRTAQGVKRTHRPRNSQIEGNFAGNPFNGSPSQKPRDHCSVSQPAEGKERSSVTLTNRPFISAGHYQSRPSFVRRLPYRFARWRFRGRGGGGGGRTVPSFPRSAAFPREFLECSHVRGKKSTASCARRKGGEGRNGKSQRARLSSAILTQPSDLAARKTSRGSVRRAWPATRARALLISENTRMSRVHYLRGGGARVPALHLRHEGLGCPRFADGVPRALLRDPGRRRGWVYRI